MSDVFIEFGIYEDLQLQKKSILQLQDGLFL